MRTLLRALGVTLLALGFSAGGAEAAEKIRVVATTTDLKALTEAVGGSLVEVDTLARGNQNAHDLEVRPSLMVKVRRADLLVTNGLELDQWAEVVVQGANNPKVIPGAPGRVDASSGLLVLEVPRARVDRSMGDVHPLGNPHYTTDPGMAPTITTNILEGLARVAPPHRATFERNRQDFLARLAQAMTCHSNRSSTTTWLFRPGSLVQAGSIRAPRSCRRLGILPAIAAEDEEDPVIPTVPWGDHKLAERVAQEAGAKAIVVANAVGAVKGADTYLDTIDYNVKAVARALK
jgi:zinc/manganese transport system substrate-binding protein